MTAESEHGRGFFEQMAVCRAPYRRLGDAIHHALGPPLGLRSIVDVGAGLGFVAGRLAELGWDATSSTRCKRGLEDRRGRRGRSPSRLDEVWRGGPTFDVVICTETAEHIDASAADTIVDNVAGRAQQLVVWSAAQPGQDWPGHVNLQPPAYWLLKFYKLGFEALGATTAALRTEMLARHAQHEHAAHSFFVLGRAT